MNFRFHLDKNGVPSNFFTSITIGVIGFVFVTISGLVPDARLLSIFVLVLIPTGWACYLVSIVGIIVNLFRLLQKFVKGNKGKDRKNRP